MNSSQTLDLVRVAVPVPLRRHFDYLSPSPLPEPGCRVEVPFGPQALVGLAVTTFAFLGVNMFLSGLHSYGEL